eukprot:TRINITY_DN11_c0_g1_i1.p1 TRINITY_DN11_c0_g1~~TRINITY_DN11_c0_g1_i1.p1  ORF type:complete len:384 (-),score=122.32 TRINITY_DN11_c0_g1_i1:93-1244(-)
MRFFVCLLVLGAVCASVKADVGCATCKTLVGEFESWLASNATEQEIETTLMKVCALLPTDLQFVCDNIVEEIPAIIAAVENKETPDTICKQLGLCQSQKVVPQTPTDTLVCEGCKFAVGAIEGWVESNKTVSEIEDLLDELCSLLPSTLETTCDRIVQVGVEEIIAWINNNESPAQICAQLGLCTSATVAVVQPQGVFECDLCKTLVGAIEGWVLSNKTVTEMEELLDQLCALLGDSVEPVCDMIVKIGVESVVEWIENNENPTEICQQLMLCPNTQAPAPAKATDTIWCSACHVIMTALEDLVESNKTVSEIEQWVDQLCELLGNAFAEVCDAIVDVGIHKIIEWINNNESPAIICQQLGLCPTSVKLAKLPLLIAQVPLRA